MWPKSVSRLVPYRLVYSDKLNSQCTSPLYTKTAKENPNSGKKISKKINCGFCLQWTGRLKAHKCTKDIQQFACCLWSNKSVFPIQWHFSNICLTVTPGSPGGMSEKDPENVQKMSKEKTSPGRVDVVV